MEKTFDKYTLLYMHTGAYAREHGELLLYRASNAANSACVTAIEDAIDEHYDGICLDSQAALQAVQVKFSLDRIGYILANTLQFKQHDGRFSRENLEWAQSVSIVHNIDPYGNDRNSAFVIDQAHSGLVNIFVNRFRKTVED